MSYSNSPLVNYTKISPNKTSPRNHVIDTITIHHMAGNLSVEACGNVFAPTSRKASANYGIGSDGRIGLYVDEKTVHGVLLMLLMITEQLLLKSQTAVALQTGLYQIKLWHH